MQRRGAARPGGAWQAVSVSTSGSKGVQPQFKTAEVREQVLFQYPQADRRGCNETTSGCQPMICSCFSIHKRIEGGATMPICPHEIRKFMRFSIHKRIEGGATRECTPGLRPTRTFQYPQADRRGCNTKTKPNNLSPSACFSIHKRIEGGATYRPAHYLYISSHSFSIHKRIEGGATVPEKQTILKIECFSIHKRIEGGATIQSD